MYSSYSGFNDIFLDPFVGDHTLSKDTDTYSDSFYSPLLSDGDLFSPSSSSGTSSPRSSAVDSLLSSDDATAPSHVDTAIMFSDDRLFQETASPPLKRRSWTSFKKTLPNSISAIEPATPKKKRSSVHLAFTFFPNHSAPPHHRKRRDSCASFTSRDGEGESDGGATDDEYLPSPSDFKARRTKSRHRRHTPYARPTNSSKGGLLVTPVRSSSRKARVSPPSRNKQSLADDANRIKEVVETSAIEDIDFQCPACGWIQANRRVPDFKRHVRTHLRKNDNEDKNGYWCKGVRVQDSSRYLLPTDAESYLFKDEARIGGCMRSFSRRDALKRHLDNPNITCVFDTLQE